MRGYKIMTCMPGLLSLTKAQSLPADIPADKMNHKHWYWYSMIWFNLI